MPLASGEPVFKPIFAQKLRYGALSEPLEWLPSCAHQIPAVDGHSLLGSGMSRAARRLASAAPGGRGSGVLARSTARAS